jgi:hypothetical protein
LCHAALVAVHESPSGKADLPLEYWASYRIALAMIRSLIFQDGSDFPRINSSVARTHNHRIDLSGIFVSTSAFVIGAVFDFNDFTMLISCNDFSDRWQKFRCHLISAGLGIRPEELAFLQIRCEQREYR